jgi:hypothetical protein
MPIESVAFLALFADDRRRIFVGNALTCTG